MDITTEPTNGITRSDLKSAKLYAADPDGTSKANGLTVYCSFNPYEYTISQSNSYGYKPDAGAGGKVEFQNAGPQTLKLNLIFDAYENTGDRDVSKVTKELWKLMTPDYITKTKKPDAPFVIFEWGVFNFLAVITNMTQKFILFDHDGVPLRAKVDITFTQHKSEKDDYQSFAAGELSVDQITPTKIGDRVDSLASDILGDPANWRDIATANKITNPLAMRPGLQLLIPGGKNG